MANASHMTRRGEVYYFRARIPAHLAARYGRAMVSRSLETTDRKTALIRARSHRAELDKELAALGTVPPKPSSEYSGSVRYLTDTDIERICDRYRSSVLVDDELARVSGMGRTLVSQDIGVLELWLPMLREAFAAGDLTDVYPRLEQFLADLNLKLEKRAPSYLRLAQRFQQADLEVQEALHKRRQGLAVATPQISVDKLTIDQVYKCWRRQLTDRPLKTIRAFEQAFEAFTSRCSAPTARLVKKLDVTSFRDQLIDERKLSPVTVEKHLSFLRAAFQCAVNDGLLEVNVFSGVKVAKGERVKKPRLPFSTEELNTIFSSAVYQPGYLARPSIGHAAYWLPLLALFSGARLEELAQLKVESICEDPQHGWYIAIRGDEDNHLKTASSWRNVPLHGTLTNQLGFLEYVRSQNGRLFPALKADKYGKVSTVFSTFYGKHLTSLGIVDSRKVFNSFRHSLIQVCKVKAATIQTEVREAIVGHVADEIVQQYGEEFYPLEPMVAAMKLIEYKELDLNRLYR